MRYIIKRVFLTIIAIILLASVGYCQDTQELLGQVAEIYTDSNALGDNLIAGFSVGGLIGGMIFASIGFGAFVYGKKSTEFRPMLLGILLMVYPYFLKNTIALYCVGIVLTVALFVWRE